MDYIVYDDIKSGFTINGRFSFQIVMVKPMKQKGKAPKVTPSVPDGSEVTVSLIPNEGQ